jgi:predicted membrane protein
MEYYNSKIIDMKKTLYTNPENIVIVKGKVFNDTSIKLPEEWEETVNPKTINVSLKSCDASQDIVVESVDIKEVRLHSYSNFPIECYYLILAERK